jgi:hypothetical protein
MGFEKEKSCGFFIDYSIFPIRKTLVPHVGHVPFTAGRPFLSVVSLGSLISLFSLHFTQYAVTILKFVKLAGI